MAKKQIKTWQSYVKPTIFDCYFITFVGENINAMKKLAFMIVALMVAMGVQAQPTAPHIYKNPTPGQLPILGWYSLKGKQVTHERYLEMAEAGFNISFSHIFTIEETRVALDAAKDSGVKVLVLAGRMGEQIEDMVKMAKDHPSTAGYFLRDEPTAEGFAELSEIAKRIRAIDDEKLLYLNLFPNYVSPNVLRTKSYVDYVRRFIDEVGLGLVSFDNYPITFKGLRKNFYANLEDIARESKRAGVPFWAFALSTAHDPYPVPTREALRLQIFSNLAYGAQGIQYFTYTTPHPNTQWNFHNGPIDEHDQRSDVYYLVKELNERVQGLSHVWLGAEVVALGHTGATIPLGTQRFEQLPKSIKKVDTDGIGLLISHLRNGKREYLMVVNRDLYKSQMVKVECSRMVRRILNGGGKQTMSDKSLDVELGAGDMLLFEL